MFFFHVHELLSSVFSQITGNKLVINEAFRYIMVTVVATVFESSIECTYTFQFFVNMQIIGT